MSTALSCDIASALVDGSPKRLCEAHRVAKHRVEQAKWIGFRALEQSWQRDLKRIEHRLRALGVAIPKNKEKA